MARTELDSAVTYEAGERLLFHPSGGKKPLKAIARYDFTPARGKVRVRIANDPFDVYVSESQLTRERESAVPTDQMTAKQLRNEAKSLSVEGWEAMSRDELEAAIRARQAPATNGTHVEKAPAKKAAAPVAKKRVSKGPVKKTTKAVQKAATAPPVAKKASATRKAAPVHKTARKVVKRSRRTANENPFRPESNSFVYCQVLKKGGVRRKLAEQIRNKVDLHPWSKSAEEQDDMSEIDKRMILVSQQLEKRFGWKIMRSGRGMEGTIKAIPPVAKAKKAS